jgi:regulatory subunit for Cdc7p protein kinase
MLSLKPKDFGILLTLCQHIATRKHRKFAATTSNWAELDALLYQLQQPLREYDYI